MTKKKIIVLSVALVLIALGVYYFFFLRSSDRGENVVDYNPPTSDQVDAGTKAKEEFINRTDQTKEDKPEATSIQSVALQISSTNQTDTTLKVRTIIQDVTGGSCQLTMSRSGSTSFQQTVDTQNLGSYSVCKGYDINVGSFDKGDWTLKIDYIANDGRKGTVTKQVTVR